MKRLVLLVLLVTADASAQIRPPANVQNDRLRTAAPEVRLAALRTVIARNRGVCPRALAAAEKGSYKGLQRWTVRCQGGRSYAVFIGVDGSVQARNCIETKQLRLPPC